MPVDPLNAQEREEIRAGIERGDRDGAIGRCVGRHRSTINAEINRNGGRRRYSAVAAQRRCDQARARPKVSKLAADPKLAAYVAKRLKAKDSPMTISIELARGVHGRVASISHETIYQAIYGQGQQGLSADLHRHLPRKHRRRKHRRNVATATNSHSLGTFNLIHTRPAIANARTQVGHLEGDLICGSSNRSAIITIFDRASRHLWLARLVTGRRADATYQALLRTLKRIPAQHRHTLTWDQGSEMARHHQLANNTGIDIYIADAHSPWQRPTNENGNALVRRYVGKGTNLNTYTTKQLRTIEHRINTIPRRSLNWATAHHTYTQTVAMTD